VLHPFGSALEGDIFVHCILCSTELDAKFSFQLLCTSYFTTKLHASSGSGKDINKLMKLFFL